MLWAHAFDAICDDLLERRNTRTNANVSFTSYFTAQVLQTQSHLTSLKVFSVIRGLCQIRGPVLYCESGIVIGTHITHASSSDPLWSSYDRTWFSRPDKQEIFIWIRSSPRFKYLWLRACRSRHCQRSFTHPPPSLIPLEHVGGGGGIPVPLWCDSPTRVFPRYSKSTE
jgi:hypothetical protein